MNKRDAEIIRLFIEHITVLDGNNFSTIQMPDLVERNAPAIDAVNEIYAVEHFSFDSYPDQRKRSAFFSDVIGKIEEDFYGAFPSELRIEIRFNALDRQSKAVQLNAALRKWIQSEARVLDFGAHTINEAPDIPFSFRVHKTPSKTGRVLFARSVGEDKSRPERFRRHAERKLGKLRSPKWESKRRILLIETPDILMSHICVWKVLCECYPPDGLPEGIDEVWHIDTFRSMLCALIAPRIGDPRIVRPKT